MMGEAIENTANKTTEKFVSKNPLVLGLGAVAIGCIIGSIVPISEFERENFGPLGDRLTDRVKDSATGLIARGKSAVVEAVSSVLG